jgi:5'-nucleotidase
MKKSALVLMLTVGTAVVIAAIGTSIGTAQSDLVKVSLLAINDFHGNLLPSGFRVPDPADRTKTLTLQAGGVEAIATAVKEVKSKNPNTIVVGGGDLIGASPLVSSLLADEPSIDALSQIGMEVGALGNHELDKGAKELLRMQKGGCEAFDPSKACKFNPSFAGAKFQYIAANVVEKATGKTFLPPYFIRKVGNLEIAFVGAVLKETPTIVLPSGVAGLEFLDEAEAVNKYIPELKAKGIETIVLLIHQGGTAKELFDQKDCGSLAGSIVDIVKRLDKAVDVVVSGHTHRGYQCRVDGRLVTQSDQYGHIMMQIDLSIDPKTKDVISATSDAIVLDSAKVAKDANMTALVTKAKTMTDPIANQPIAKLGVEQITRDATPAGESALGDVIADSQLEATKAPEKGGAVIAFMNPGGIRAHLPPNPSASKDVTYGDAFTVQPFGNSLVVLSLTGAQIKTLLEQQFENPAAGQNRILQISKGFAYTWDAKKPQGEKVLEVSLNGAALDPAKAYRITVNNFLADGGDNFAVLKEGKDRVGGEVDLDALQLYLQAQAKAGTPVGMTARDRIKVVNQ